MHANKRGYQESKPSHRSCQSGLRGDTASFPRAYGNTRITGMSTGTYNASVFARVSARAHSRRRRSDRMSLDKSAATSVGRWIQEVRSLLSEAEQCVDAGLSRCPYESNGELRQARDKARQVARALTALNRKVANLRTAIEVRLHEQDSQLRKDRP
jgi:hypothetical protein